MTIWCTICSKKGVNLVAPLTLFSGTPVGNHRSSMEVFFFLLWGARTKKGWEPLVFFVISSFVISYFELSYFESHCPSPNFASSFILISLDLISQFNIFRTQLFQLYTSSPSFASSFTFHLAEDWGEKGRHRRASPSNHRASWGSTLRRHVRSRRISGDNLLISITSLNV